MPPAEEKLVSGDAASRVVEVECGCVSDMYASLENHRDCTVEIHMADAVQVFAELRDLTRDEILRMAIRAWFSRALDLPVLEVNCFEQPHNEEKGTTGLLLFQVRLDFGEDRAVDGEEVLQKYRARLIGALPGDMSYASVDQMLQQIKWADGESRELRGVATLSIVVVLVMIVGLGCPPCIQWPCPCNRGTDANSCPCVSRASGSKAALREAVLHKLHTRGTVFEFGAGGTAILRVLPQKSAYEATCSLM
eukprot:gnl/TRDRNA2_/TRDRNA2_72201_c0_seq1.p1 gnl/TRDRNA2_/TRDRNA2_72201_c0~~gnl/TRDRNA2_/TRDRNA2_72201_c0_seq1.p1  ORF type:complete len:250 (+),score=24.49 gnl/TRDRNA2_/TRDRNA2_72201_c0_seq1:105-854(+)